MASTQQKREWWAEWRCNPLQMVTVSFPGTDRDWNLPVADKAAPAFHLFSTLMRKHGYLFEEVSGGTYNCRKIAGTDSWSLHAYGIAVDLNPSRNPYGTTRHDFPQGFIDDVLETGLFRWGMDFRDPMHWEIDVPPSAIGEEDMLTPHEEAVVKRMVAELDALGSDGTFAKYAVQHLRNHPTSGTTDTTARLLAREAKDAINSLLDKLRRV